MLCGLSGKPDQSFVDDGPASRVGAMAPRPLSDAPELSPIKPASSDMVVVESGLV